MVLLNASLATPGGTLTTMQPSALVRVSRLHPFANKTWDEEMIGRACCPVAVNKCVCNNGFAPIDGHCAVDGAAKCASCKTGWTINQFRTECIRTYIHEEPNVLIKHVFVVFRKYVHVQVRHSTNCRGLSGEWRCKVRGMQHRFYYQPRQN